MRSIRCSEILSRLYALLSTSSLSLSLSQNMVVAVITENIINVQTETIPSSSTILNVDSGMQLIDSRKKSGRNVGGDVG